MSFVWPCDQLCAKKVLNLKLPYTKWKKIVTVGIFTLISYSFLFSRGFYEKGFNVWEEDYDVCLLSETKLCLSHGPRGDKDFCHSRRLTKNSNRDGEKGMEEYKMRE